MTPAHELSSVRAGGKAAARRAAWLFSWPLLIGTAVYLLVFLHGTKLLLDGDTYWHIAAGQWMLQHGAVPTQDPFSHSMPGAAWTAHEWLSQVILAAAHQVGGWHVVVATTALAFAASLALLTRALLRWLEPIYALLFAALAVLMAATLCAIEILDINSYLAHVAGIFPYAALGYLGGRYYVFARLEESPASGQAAEPAPARSARLLTRSWRV